MDQLDKSWDELCNSLRELGNNALALDDPLDRAEGLRYTLRFLGHLADQHIEYADPLHPEFRRMTGHTRKFMGDGVDVDYLSATIDGKHTYRVRGTRGTAPYLGFLVYRVGRNDRIAGSLIDEELDIAADGSFELWVSPTRQDGPGLLTDDRCVELTMREYHKDRAGEVPATVEIEVVGEVPPRPPLDPDWLDVKLGRVSAGLDVLTGRYLKTGERLARQPNELLPMADAATGEIYGTSSNKYVCGWFRLRDGEALELRFPPPKARYFSVQLFNHWWESLESRDYVTSLNDAQLEYEDDGSVVVVVGGPEGARNRLDPCGHAEGAVAVRYLEGLDEVPTVACRVLPAR